jgi:hypothetical protein
MTKLTQAELDAVLDLTDPADTLLQGAIYRLHERDNDKGRAPKSMRPGYYIMTTRTPGDSQPPFHYYEEIEPARAAATLLGKHSFFQITDNHLWVRRYLREGQ